MSIWFNFENDDNSNILCVVQYLCTYYDLMEMMSQLFYLYSLIFFRNVIKWCKSSIKVGS